MPELGTPSLSLAWVTTPSLRAPYRACRVGQGWAGSLPSPLPSFPLLWASPLPGSWHWQHQARASLGQDHVSWRESFPSTSLPPYAFLDLPFSLHSPPLHTTPPPSCPSGPPPLSFFFLQRKSQVSNPEAGMAGSHPRLQSLSLMEEEARGLSLASSFTRGNSSGRGGPDTQS